MVIDFSGVFERYSLDIYRFALYLWADHALAADICQETFVRAWVTSGEIREGTIKGYLLAIARNLYRDEMTRKARQISLDDRLPDPKPGPSATAEARIELRAVLAALQILAEIDRAVLLMSAQEGMSQAAIAAALGLSVTAVKVRIHRARLKLKQILNAEKG